MLQVEKVTWSLFHLKGSKWMEPLAIIRQWILCEDLMSLCEIIWAFDYNEKIHREDDQIFWVSTLPSECLNMTPEITKQMFWGPGAGTTPGLPNQCLRGRPRESVLLKCPHGW